jgi:hypothetical protein
MYRGRRRYLRGKLFKQAEIRFLVLFFFVAIPLVSWRPTHASLLPPLTNLTRFINKVISWNWRLFGFVGICDTTISHLIQYYDCVNEMTRSILKDDDSHLQFCSLAWRYSWKAIMHRRSSGVVCELVRCIKQEERSMDDDACRRYENGCCWLQRSEYPN